MTRFRFLLALVLGLFLVLGGSEASADGMIYTGQAIRTKSIGFITVNVYQITHNMAAKPAAKTKQAVIDADVDKVFTWTMKRDVDSSKIKKALQEAFAMNGYGDGGKIGTFLSAFSAEEVKEGAKVTIYYSAKSQTVTINVGGGKTASIAGLDFMKGVWSIWLGKIDQPSMGDQLIASLPAS